VAEVEKPEVFRGHLDECLRHFSERFSLKFPKGSKGAARAKEPMAEFCGINTPTVTRWFRDDASLPVGEPLFKLMCFLDLSGYRVIELEKMKPGSRGFAELIAFGIFKGQEAADMLGYQNLSTLYQVLRGKEGMSDAKSRKMWDVWQEKRALLEEKKSVAHRKYYQNLTVNGAPAAGPSPAPKGAGRPRTKTPDYTATVKVMEALLALLERENLDELPEGELAVLCRASGETILRLSARLSTLSSKLLAPDRRKGGG